MGVIRRWFDKWKREWDMDELWPACLRFAKDHDHAKAAFLTHVRQDPAWTRYFTDIELFQFVDDL
jgi:hypothetical protein